jgi:hypothetical protein
MKKLSKNRSLALLARYKTRILQSACRYVSDTYPVRIRTGYSSKTYPWSIRKKNKTKQIRYWGHMY